MANPQLEDGFVKIANELFEAMMRIRISGESRQVLDTIIRKTFGYNKKEDAISLSQFVGGTGLKKNTVCRAIQKLMEMGIITKKENAIANIYGVVKDFENWRPLPKKRMVVTNNEKGSPAKEPAAQASENDGIEKEEASLPKKRMVVTNNENFRYQKCDTQKTVTKDNITKDSAAGKKSSAKLTDEEFIQSLKKNPAYVGIDIDRELGKMQAWLLSKPGRKMSRPFMVNWLNRCEVPVKPRDPWELTDAEVAREVEHYTKNPLKQLTHAEMFGLDKPDPNPPKTLEEARARIAAKAAKEIEE